ncbi:MAG: methionyl-tRNA formyltransferase [Elusimicrobiota bacterium]
MRIVFFGTPEYVIPIFEYLLKNEEVVCVVTRSDKPSGRHFQSVPSPVKKLTIEKKIPVLTPENLKDKNFFSQFSRPTDDGMATFNPQLAIVAAYGKILPKEILNIFPLGCINLHFSILPKYRGAAPIQWAIIKGEKKTGVTSFFMDEGLDTGKIISQIETEIKIDDTADTLREKLIPVAIDVLSETLKKIKDGFKGELQGNEVNYAPPLKKEDGKINWNKPVEEIHNMIRGMKPWPSAYTQITNCKPSSQFCLSEANKTKLEDFQQTTNLKILEAEKIQICSDDNLQCPACSKPGQITEILKNTGFVVRCNPGFLLIKTVQPASKNVMSAWAFLLGYKFFVGDQLS